MQVQGVDTHSWEKTTTLFCCIYNYYRRCFQPFLLHP